MIFFLLSLWKQGLEFSRALGMGREARAVWEVRTEDLWNFLNCVTAKTRSQEAGKRGRTWGPGTQILVLATHSASLNGGVPLLPLSPSIPTCESGMIPALSHGQGRRGCQREYRNERVFSNTGLDKQRGPAQQRATPLDHDLLPIPSSLTVGIWGRLTSSPTFVTSCLLFLLPATLFLAASA